MAAVARQVFVAIVVDRDDAKEIGRTLRSWSDALSGRCPDDKLVERLGRVGDSLVAASARPDDAIDAEYKVLAERDAMVGDELDRAHEREMDECTPQSVAYEIGGASW